MRFSYLGRGRNFLPSYCILLNLIRFSFTNLLFVSLDWFAISTRNFPPYTCRCRRTCKQKYALGAFECVRRTKRQKRLWWSHDGMCEFNDTYTRGLTRADILQYTNTLARPRFYKLRNISRKKEKYTAANRWSFIRRLWSWAFFVELVSRVSGFMKVIFWDRRQCKNREFNLKVCTANCWFFIRRLWSRAWTRVAGFPKVILGDPKKIQWIYSELLS